RLVRSVSTVNRSPRNSVRCASNAARRTVSRAAAIAEEEPWRAELEVMASSRGGDGSGQGLGGADPVGILVAAARTIPPCQHSGGVQGQPARGLAGRLVDLEPDQS